MIIFVIKILLLFLDPEKSFSKDLDLRCFFGLEELGLVLLGVICDDGDYGVHIRLLPARPWLLGVLRVLILLLEDLLTGLPPRVFVV